MAVEVCATDVIKLIVQFLQENHLSRAASVLQEEAGVEFLQLKEKHKLLEAIEAGSWTEALAVLSTLPLPPDVSAQVHEQIFKELLQSKKFDTAKALLRQSQAVQQYREKKIEWYLSLENLLSRAQASTGNFQVFSSEQIKTQRDRIKNILDASIVNVRPARLMALIQSAIKWEQACDNIPRNTKIIDLLSMEASHGEPETSSISFPKKSTPSVPSGFKCVECLCFTGQDDELIIGGLHEQFGEGLAILSSGSSDHGLADENFFRHTSAIPTVCKLVGDCLVAGTEHGGLMAWDWKSGQERWTIPRAFHHLICAISPSVDGKMILACDGQQSAKLFTESSTKARSHYSMPDLTFYDVAWISDMEQFACGHDKGFFTLWNVDELKPFKQVQIPLAEAQLAPPAVAKILPMPALEAILLLTNSSTATIYSIKQDRFLGGLSIPESVPGEFVAAIVRSKYIACLTNSGKVLSFSTEAPFVLISTVDVSVNEPYAFAMHAARNSAVVVDVDGNISMWT